ncbi:GtrA family protein [Martelella soudanensis]|nr:GtrA family protein [Martelella sp. NC18]
MALLILVLVAGVNFAAAQAIATIITMIVNFSGNNLLTYYDQQLRGRGFFQGLLLYIAVCGIGAVVNVGIATALFTVAGPWWVAGLAGAFVSGLWNYLVTQALVWNRSGAL